MHTTKLFQTVNGRLHKLTICRGLPYVALTITEKSGSLEDLYLQEGQVFESMPDFDSWDDDEVFDHMNYLADRLCI